MNNSKNKVKENWFQFLLNMSQCVPSWEVDENPQSHARSASLRSNSNSTAPHDVPMSALFSVYSFYLKNLIVKLHVWIDTDVEIFTRAVTKLLVSDFVKFTVNPNKKNCF